jgi:putative methionine-R-sulfoxide reductase with GAF domain
MITHSQRDQVLASLDQALSRTPDLEAAGAAAIALLSERLPHYDWVGIYWLEGRELVLGPFRGAPTEHTRIPVGKGVCGTAVVENSNQVIADVSRLDNYLSCSANVRSEIVVLVRDANGGILGQIDADSHTPGAFDRTDEELLEETARRIVAQAEAES